MYICCNCENNNTKHCEYCYQSLLFKTIERDKNNNVEGQINIIEALKELEKMKETDILNNSIQLKNIDLQGLTIEHEILKSDEENEELNAAIDDYLNNPCEDTKNHLLEEICDNIQVQLSKLTVLKIDLKEFINYWNNEHLINKIPNRPQNKK